MKEQHREKIEQCMNCFEFGKVKKVMDFMDWRWIRSGVYEDGEEPPTTYQLMRTAKELLESVAELDCVSSGTGGFIAERRGDEFRLAFEVTSWYTSV